MNNALTISVHQIPGTVSFDNYEEVKSALQRKMNFYGSIVASPDQLNSARQTLSEMKEDRDLISKTQKELEKAYSQPFADVNAKLNELLSIIDAVYKPLKQFVDETEKKEKEEEILRFAEKEAEQLGEIGKKLISSPEFFNKDWLLKKYTVKKYQDEISAIIEQAGRDLESIRVSGGKYTQALTAHYLSSLSMESVKSFRETLKEDLSAEEPIEISSEDAVLGYKILKITATEDQMASLLDQMELMGLEVEELEDGMPKSLEELIVPDFTSFVAFDIETTGSFGAGSGDDEAKITEIGAVRVVNGEVTARFDELANPGRKIVPRIARLTHITDEMVHDKPPIDEVIRMFADFCGDSILVGHNIKSSDLHYITKAAKKAGVRMENQFLDTYILAKQFKDRMGWEKLNLGFLSEFYGIEHKDKHRAWSDAEANAIVYKELKRIFERS